MTLLVISRNETGEATSLKKFPGVRLVEALSAFGAFTLVDVPSYLNTWSPRGIARILHRYLSAVVTIVRYRDEEVFFYNLPKAYLPLYAAHVLTRFARPGLFLADGVNCTKMEHNELAFLALFNRLISLPMNDVLRAIARDLRRVIWFPGFAGVTPVSPRRARSKAGSATLMYNSSLVPHNEPESLITLVEQRPWLSVVVTDTEESYRRYLLTINSDPTRPLPERLRFAGPLNLTNYRNLACSVDGVLLCRDEAQFANRYNFPSKLIEAIQLGVPIICTHPIGAIRSELYCMLGGGESNSALWEYLEQYHTGAFGDAEREFLALCDAQRLMEWLQDGPHEMVRGADAR